MGRTRGSRSPDLFTGTRANARPPNISARNDKDSYPTPQWCIDGLVRALAESGCVRRDDVPVDVVIDIGAGDGRIGESVRTGVGAVSGMVPRLVTIEPFPASGYQPTHVCSFGMFMADELERLDGKRLLFVSNPPFSLSHQIVGQTLDYLYAAARQGSLAVFLLRMDWRASKTVAAGLWKRYVPFMEFPMAPRPSFKVGASGSTTDFYNCAWHVWRRPANGETVNRWSWPIVRNG